MIKHQKTSGYFRRGLATFVAMFVCATLISPAISQEKTLIQNVIDMHKMKLDPAMIKGAIRGAKNVKLSLSDKKKLKAAGVSDDLIAELEKAANAGIVPSPEPAPEPAPEVGGADELESLRDMDAQDAAEREEAAKIKEAARLAAEQKRKQLAAQDRKRVAAALQTARSALEEGNYAQAAQLFDTFLKTANPKRPSTLDAKLGYADALRGIGLYGNAAKVYLSLVSAGPDTSVFVPAFEGLRKCTKKITFQEFAIEGFANHFVGDKKPAFKDSYNYFLGKFFFDFNRYEEARKYLNEVSAKGVDYPGAQYLMGLIQVAEAGTDKEDPNWAKTLIRATSSFQRAVTGSEESGDSRIGHLAYLALARISYSVGLYNVALYYYRKIPYDSTSYVNALHESGWTYFLKNDIRRGLGIFHTLDGPDWETAFLPDMHLLEATVFMNTCHFKYAHDALKRIDTRFLALRKPLEKFMTTYPGGEALYDAFVDKKLKNAIDLPRKLRLAVIASPGFHDGYTTATHYRREFNLIKAATPRLGTDLASRLLKTVDAARTSNTVRLGLTINGILQGLAEELDTLDVQKTEIQIEIDETAAQELEQSIQDTIRGPSAAKVAAEAQETATIFVGDQYVTWPFEGEFWADEINSYRSDLKEVCKR